MIDISTPVIKSGIDTSEMPDDLIFGGQERVELAKNLDFDGIIPLVLEKKKLMSPGVWNNMYYDADTISRAYSGTDWGERKNRDLFLDHEDERTSEWVGEVKNIVDSKGEMYGDLYIYDLPTAIKLKYGNPKIGISPALSVSHSHNEAESFVFRNFSLVINPACKTTFINNSDEIFNVKEVKRMTDVGQVAMNTEPVTALDTIGQDALAKKKEEEKYPPATEAKPEIKTPEESKKPEEDEELSAYTEFFKKMKAKGWTPGKIGEAWSAKKMAEELSEEELGMILEEMRCKKPKAEEYPAPKELEALKETVETLSEKIDKLNQPERLSVKSAGLVSESETDVMELSHINYKDVDWEMAEYLKKEVTQ